MENWRYWTLGTKLIVICILTFSFIVYLICTLAMLLGNILFFAMAMGMPDDGIVHWALFIMCFIASLFYYADIRRGHKEMMEDLGRLR